MAELSGFLTLPYVFEMLMGGLAFMTLMGIGVWILR